MKMDNYGLQQLMQSEGFKTTIYYDSAGYATVGVGHLLNNSELASGKILLKNGDVIDLRKGDLSPQQVRAILADDVENAEKCVTKLVTVPLLQHQFNALVSFVFNVGCGAFSKSTLLKRLNSGRFDDVPAQLRRWNRAGGTVVKGLVSRREREIGLWVDDSSNARNFNSVEIENPLIAENKNSDDQEFRQWQAQKKDAELKGLAVNEWIKENSQRSTESRTNRSMYGLIATGIALIAIRFGAPESLKTAENLRLIEDVLTIAVPIFGAVAINFRNRATKFITKQKFKNHA